MRDRLEVAARRLQPGRGVALAHLALGTAHDRGSQQQPVALAPDAGELVLDRTQLALDVADRARLAETGELGAQLLLAQHEPLAALPRLAQLGDERRVLVVGEQQALPARLALARVREQGIQVGNAPRRGCPRAGWRRRAARGGVQPLERVGLVAVR